MEQNTNTASLADPRQHAAAAPHSSTKPVTASLVELEAAMRFGNGVAAAEFDRYASEYSELLRDPIRDFFAVDALFFQRRKWELLEAELKRREFRQAGSNWLDVGCGKGELLSLGHRFFSRAVGCDPSANMIHGKSDVVFQSHPNKLPFPGGSFDLVTAVCVYHHVPIDERQILSAEIFRVLRPGGVACFMEHNPLNPVTRRIVSRTPVDTGARLASHWEMTALARSVGLRRPVSRFFLYLPEKMYASLSGIESLLQHVPLGGQYALFCERPDRAKSVRSGARFAFGVGMPAPLAL